MKVITEAQGKKAMEDIVRRYSSEDIIQLVKDHRISEQDITTKFVLPMLAALNWDTYRIDKNGPEVSEKAYKDKLDVGKGLPDIILKNANHRIFVEVKKPPLGFKGKSNLERYGDSELIILTTFGELALYCRSKKNKPYLWRSFESVDYVPKFRELWHTLSNTEEAKQARAGIKAHRRTHKR